MKNKINNIKHHKYTKVNKKERKKNKITVNFKYNIVNIINKNYKIDKYYFKNIIKDRRFIIIIKKLFAFSIYKIYINKKYIKKNVYKKINTKNCKLIYNDCNHLSYKLIKKKNKIN